MKSFNYLGPVFLVAILVGGLFAVKTIKDQMDDAYSSEMNNLLDSVASISRNDDTDDQKVEPDIDTDEVPDQKNPEATANNDADETYLHSTEERGINPAFMTKDGSTWVYKIQKGDTLSGLSGSFLYSVQDLAQFNGIGNPNLIYAGSSLRIPSNTQE